MILLWLQYHYVVYEVGDTGINEIVKPIITNVKNLVECIASGNPEGVKLLPDGEIIRAERTYEVEELDAALTLVYIQVWSNIEIMQKDGICIFYPVHKLIGHKIGNILKRCGIRHLIYPYALEPMDQMVLKAQNYITPYGTTTFLSVQR